MNGSGVLVRLPEQGYLVTVRRPVLSPCVLWRTCWSTPVRSGTGKYRRPGPAASPPGARSPATPREAAPALGNDHLRQPAQGGTGRCVPPEAGSSHTASLPPATSTVPASKGAGVSAEYTAPVLVTAESVSLKPVAGASSGNRRFPRPTATGKASSRYSSIRPARCSDWASAQLP